MGAIRALHEQQRLFSKMHEQALQSGHHVTAAGYEATAAQATMHAESLRDVIATLAVAKPDVS